jgi:hypothetical protein
LENPGFEEIHLCLLLGRADLSTMLLEEIASHKQWMTSYRVKRALAFHHNILQTVGLRLVRELFAHDLAGLSSSALEQPCSTMGSKSRTRAARLVSR